MATLVNGQTELALTARRGEIVRYEHEQFVEAVLLAPSERVVVDARFDEPGELTLEHRTPHRAYPLATIAVTGEQLEGSLAAEFGTLRTNADMVAERERIAPYIDAEPDETVALDAEMDMGEPELPPGAAVAYVCPMHPEVIRDEPDRCPKCGMKLVATEASLVGEQGDEHHHESPTGEGHGHETGGIEWEDDMVEVNRMTTPANMRWKPIDRSTGSEGQAIDWRFRVGIR